MNPWLKLTLGVSITLVVIGLVLIPLAGPGAAILSVGVGGILLTLLWQLCRLTWHRGRSAVPIRQPTPEFPTPAFPTPEATADPISSTGHQLPANPFAPPEL